MATRPVKPLTRKKKSPFLLIIFLLLWGLSLFSQEKLPPLTPYKADIPPVMDGILDDPVWQKSPHETGFKTFVPDFEKDMKEKTLVYYAYDRENLYFAFRCYDSQPDKIKATLNRRDNIRSDDYVCINLDSFNDNQSLYALYANPLGIQEDSTFEGGTEDKSVDVVWYSEGRIDEKGYSVELRIPFKSIRFSHKEPVEMGVIFERRISRYSESGTYPPLDPDYGYNFLSQTRTLIFKDIKHYTLLEILPGVTYHKGSAMEEGKLRSSKGRGDISLTGKYGITSNLILDGTYNPDFSQVEADAGQVDFNLRYALYFPEKRPFFLEGLEKFYYGGYYQGDPLRAVVHTRTIVDPSWGFKLNGKIGDNNTIATIYAKDDLPDTEEDPHAYVGIFRYKRALAKDGFIGGFYTGRERQNGFNRVYGLDSQIRVNPSNLLGGHFFMSQTRSGMTEEFDRNEGHALGIHYLYHTRDWILMAGFQDIDKGFYTETGYMTRRGISRLRSEITRMFYPELKFLRRIDSTIHSFQTRDKFSGLYETDNSLGLRFTLLRNSSFRLSYQYSTEIFMSEKFQTSGFSVMARNQFSKKFSLFVTYNYGEKIRYISDPFQGTGSDASAIITYLPTEKLHLNLRLAYSDFYRGYDSKKEFDYTIIRNRITYQVNKYLFFRAIVEYNSFRKELMTDFLASFSYIPGTVIHVGYGSLNEKIQWNGTEYRASHRFLETKRDFFFKASYLWRF